MSEGNTKSLIDPGPLRMWHTRKVLQARGTVGSSMRHCVDLWWTEVRRRLLQQAHLRVSRTTWLNPTARNCWIMSLFHQI
jgi:hypothetical protein